MDRWHVIIEMRRSFFTLVMAVARKKLVMRFLEICRHLGEYGTFFSRRLERPETA